MPSPAPLRLQALTFDRVSVGGHGAAIPLAASSGGGAAAVDWTDDGPAFAVAFPHRAAHAASVTIKLRIGAGLGPAVFVRARDTSARPLGDLAPTRVPAYATGTSLATLRLVPGLALAKSGVGRFAVDWLWEYSTDSINWLPLGSEDGQQSRHDVFTILGEPKAPWGRPGMTGKFVLWRDVLDRACDWADGLRDAKSVGQALVSGVYGLGDKVIPDRQVPARIHYDGGASVLGGNDRVFPLEKFLSTALLKPGSFPLLQCADCAGAVALLGSAVGCPLRVAKIEPAARATSFRTKRIKLLGAHRVTRAAFFYHDVASTVVRYRDRAWDACLKLNMDAVSTTLELAAGATLARPRAQGTYLERLSTSKHKPVVTLLGGDGLRFPYDPGQPHKPLPDSECVAKRKRRYRRLMAGARRSAPIPNTNPENFLSDALTDRAMSSHITPLQIIQNETALYSLLTKRVCFPAQTDPVRIVSSVTGTTRDDATELFLSIAAGFTTRLEPRPAVRDFAFWCPRFGSLLMLRGNTVVLIASDVPYLENPDDKIVDPVPELTAAINAILDRAYSLDRRA